MEPEVCRLHSQCEDMESDLRVSTAQSVEYNWKWTSATCKAGTGGFFLRCHVICNAQGFCGAEWKGANAPQKPKCDGRCRQVPNVSVVQDDFLAITEFKLIWWHQTHRKAF